MLRQIVKIDEEKCTGCGLCVPGCAEGAIKIENGKAKLISDNLCDGLGNCLGHCPEGAIEIIEREADEFDEEAVESHLNTMQEIPNNTKLSGHHGGGCPGSRVMTINQPKVESQGTKITSSDIEISIRPQLTQWPVQLKLVPEKAPFLDGRELLVTADCVPIAFPNYHLELLKGKSVVIGCPKLDDIQYYTEKLTNIVSFNDIKGITVAFMEVPCCRGIEIAVDEAVRRSGKVINVNKVKIMINGKRENL